MIVPMKKVALIVQSKDSDETIRQLGILGVVHIENQITPQGKDITQLQEDAALASRAAEILSVEDYMGKSGLKNAIKIFDWRFAAKHIVDLYLRIDQLGEYSRVLKNKISQWEIWGDFDPNLIASLRSKGIFIKLHSIPTADLKKIPDDVAVKSIFSDKGTVGIVTISRRDIEMPFKELELDKMSLGQIRARFEENEMVIAQIKDSIRKYTTFLERFDKIRSAMEKELEFHEAMRGAEISGKLACVTGYIPIDEVKALTSAARREKWGLIVSDPSEDDIVPTLVRNPHWISIIQPVFRLIEVVPGYRELDISLCFMIFLSIFFGMLIGDAGYGAIYFIMTLFAQVKFGRKTKNKSIFALLYVLSSCAIVWGLLSGTFFGQAWLPAWVKPLAPALRDDARVQSLCFLIGAIHLSIGHIWRAITKAPSSTALADVGWILVLWGGYFLAKLLILGQTFPDAAKWLFIVGPVLIVFFSNPNKNILKGIGAGLGTLLLNIVNSFTDVVSYVRLFAVGLAGVAISDAFNNMAAGIGIPGFFGGLIMSLVLIIGHGLDLVLGPMSVLVHGVRLNVLEFCSHVDIKWSGFNYKPLAAGPKD